MYRYLDGGRSEAGTGTEWKKSVAQRIPPYSCFGCAVDRIQYNLEQRKRPRSLLSVFLPMEGLPSVVSKSAKSKRIISSYRREDGYVWVSGEKSNHPNQKMSSYC